MEVTDHGYKVNPSVRCRAITKKDRQCALFAISGLDMCALHAGIAKARGKPGFGDPRAVEAVKRGQSPVRPAPAPASSRGAYVR